MANCIKTWANGSLVLANMERRWQSTLFFCSISEVLQALLGSILDMSKQSEHLRCVVPWNRSWTKRMSRVSCGHLLRQYGANLFSDNQV